MWNVNTFFSVNDELTELTCIFKEIEGYASCRLGTRSITNDRLANEILNFN